MTSKPKTLAQGAEAIITLKDKVVTKNRIPKSYRIKILDEKIRKQRTKAETKLLLKASKIVSVPELLTIRGGRVISRERKGNPVTSGVRSREGKSLNHQIKMQHIKGQKLSDYLNKFPITKQKHICKQIGQSIAKLHNENIIHGDLTTSNMILSPPSSKKISPLTKFPAKKSGKADFVVTNRASAPNIYFIDFGLGFISHKIEDKAVELHLLKQALEAKHFQNWETLFKEVIKGYSKSSKGGMQKGWALEAKKILKQLEKVERRGRYKH